MKRPLLTVALLFTGGIVLAEFVAAPPGAPFVVAALSLALAAAWPRGRPWLLCGALVLAGWVNASLRSAILSPHDLRALAGGQPQLATLRGRIAEPPVERVFER